MNSVKTPVRILDKRKKCGFFGPSYYVTVKFLEPSIKSNRVQEQEVPAEQFYDLEIGIIYNITMHKHSDGFWRSRPE